MRGANETGGSFPKGRFRIGAIKLAEGRKHLTDGQVVEKFQLFDGSQIFGLRFKQMVNVVGENVQIGNLDQQALNLQLFEKKNLLLKFSEIISFFV